MRSYLAITKALLLGLLRDRSALFFSLVLPLIFLLIFGPLFADSGERSMATAAVYTTAAPADRALLENAIRQVAGLKAVYYDSLEEVSYQVALQQADFGLGWDGSTLEVLRNPARFQDNEIFRQLSEGIRSHLDRQRMDIREFLTVRIVESAPMGQAGGEQGYMFPGVIAVGVMSSGLFLISSSFLYMKERFVLKRLAATPMRKLYFLAGLITTRMALSALSACLVLVVGGLVLGVRLPINWPLFALYLVAATLIMSGAGAVLALVAKSARSASEIAGLGMTIMMFVSGVYFPLEFLPPYFKAASLVLPATYVARGFRFVMGVEPMPGMRFIQETLLLCGLALAAIWIVAVKGSWEAE